MRAGNLDREITFEARTVTQGGARNRQTVSWGTHATVFAQVQDILPSRAQSIADGLSIARRPCRIRCHWRDDITSDMRIDFEGRKLRIVSGPVEIGRRKGLEMMAEEWSTEGVAP